MQGKGRGGKGSSVLGIATANRSKFRKMRDFPAKRIIQLPRGRGRGGEVGFFRVIESPRGIYYSNLGYYKKVLRSHSNIHHKNSPTKYLNPSRSTFLLTNHFRLK